MTQPITYNPNSDIIIRLRQTPIIDKDNKTITFLVTRLKCVIVQVKFKNWLTFTSEDTDLEDYEDISVEHELFITPERKKELSDRMNALMLPPAKPPLLMRRFLMKEYDKISYPYMTHANLDNDSWIAKREVLFPDSLIPTDDEVYTIDMNVDKWRRNISTIFVPVPITGHANAVNFYLPLNCHSYLIDTQMSSMVKENYSNYLEFYACIPFVDHTRVISTYKAGKLIMTKTLSLDILESLVRHPTTSSESDLYLMGGAVMDLNDDEIVLLISHCVDSENYIQALKYFSSFSKFEHVVVDTLQRPSGFNIMSYLSRHIDHLRTKRDVIGYRHTDLKSGHNTNLDYYKSYELESLKEDEEVHILADMNDIDEIEEAYDEAKYFYEDAVYKVIRAATAMAEDNCVRLHEETTWKRLKAHIYVDPTNPTPSTTEVDQDGFSPYDIVNFMRVLNAKPKYVQGPMKNGNYTLQAQGNTVFLVDGTTRVNFAHGEQPFKIAQERTSIQPGQIRNWFKNKKLDVSETAKFSNYRALFTSQYISPKQRDQIVEFAKSRQSSIADAIKHNLTEKIRTDGLPGESGSLDNSGTSPQASPTCRIATPLTADEYVRRSIEREKQKKTRERNAGRKGETGNNFQKAFDAFMENPSHASLRYLSSINTHLSSKQLIAIQEALKDIVTVKKNKTKVTPSIIISKLGMISNKREALDSFDMLARLIVRSDQSSFKTIRVVIDQISAIHQRYYNMVTNNVDTSLNTIQDRLIELITGLSSEYKSELMTIAASNDVEMRDFLLRKLKEKLEQNDTVSDNIAELFQNMRQLMDSLNVKTLPEAHFYNAYHEESAKSPLTSSGNSPVGRFSLEDLRRGDDLMDRLANEAEARRRTTALLPEYSHAVAEAYINGDYHHAQRPDGRGSYVDSLTATDLTALDTLLGISQPTAFITRVRKVSKEKEIPTVQMSTEFFSDQQVVTYLTDFINNYDSAEGTGNTDIYEQAAETAMNNTTQSLNVVTSRVRSRNLRGRRNATVLEQAVNVIAELLGIDAVSNLIKTLFEEMFKN